MKCENFFCDNYSELKTQNCKRYSGWIFDDCEARKNFRKLVEEKFTSDNSDYITAVKRIKNIINGRGDSTTKVLKCKDILCRLNFPKSENCT